MRNLANLGEWGLVMAHRKPLAKALLWRNLHHMQNDPPPDQTARLQLRLFFAHGAMLGPGKAELLEHIRDTGSISAAGRAMEMSYKRAWMLVDAMNAAFTAPLVESARGGAGGGGAQVTEVGLEVLRLYRALQDKAARAGQAEMAAISAMLRDIPEQK